MTSADVIHSFWIPKLNGKRDVVPGRISNLTLRANSMADLAVAGEARVADGSFLFLGQCAEFCGLAHADMRVRAFVHDDTSYAHWVVGQLEPSLASGPGWETFTATCTVCHQVTVVEGETVSTVGPEHFIDVGEVAFRASLAPNLTHFGSRSTFGGATFTNDRDHLAEWLADPSALKPMDPDRNDELTREDLLKREPVRILGMPDFGLSGDDIAALVDLLKSWSEGMRGGEPAWP